MKKIKEIVLVFMCSQGSITIGGDITGYRQDLLLKTEGLMKSVSDSNLDFGQLLKGVCEAYGMDRWYASRNETKEDWEIFRIVEKYEEGLLSILGETIYKTIYKVLEAIDKSDDELFNILSKIISPSINVTPNILSSILSYLPPHEKQQLLISCLIPNNKDFQEVISWMHFEGKLVKDIQEQIDAGKLDDGASIPNWDDVERAVGCVHYAIERFAKIMIKTLDYTDMDKYLQTISQDKMNNIITELEQELLKLLCKYLV